MKENLIVESDNLIALNNLLNEYEGKIDCITIDPPYNTDIEYIGYKDQNYSEGYSEFIKARLLVAKRLMSKCGVMYINIDENELINITQLCYGLFGKQNVNILVWKKVDKKYDANRIEKPVYNIKSTNEYIILCYKDKENTKLMNVHYDDGVRPLESIIDGFGTTSSAKDEIAELLGSREVFSTPKPMRLIKELIRTCTDKNSIVLDFFAGSGTAGHATMDLNKEDGGNRKFILITNSESDICKNVTIPRIDKAIEKYEYDEKVCFQS